MLDIDKSILDKSVYEISESELSKVLIASVLLCNPDIIIFDEILDSFDSINKIKIIKLFIKLKKFFNKTIIIVSSNIDDIYEFIDEIIIIDDGKVLYFGDKYKVYNNYGYFHILGNSIAIGFDNLSSRLSYSATKE